MKNAIVTLFLCVIAVQSLSANPIVVPGKLSTEICGKVVAMIAMTLHLDLNRNAIFRAIKRLEIRLIQAGSLPSDKA